MHSRILLLQTGGTLDAEAYPDPENPPQNVKTLKGGDSLLMPTLATLAGHENIDRFYWTGSQEDRLNKDSKAFTPQDIRELAYIIEQDGHNHFILTHGTDAMVANAQLLAGELKASGKTVVITGSMVPLSMHEKHGSDAPETLGYVLEHIHTLAPGVYVAGRDAQTQRLGFFDPAKVQKDRKASLERLQFTLASR